MSALALAVAYVVGVVAVGRATRLVIHDPWPPIAWVRDRWKVRTALTDDGAPVINEKGELEPGPWTPLLTCPWCASPYLTAVALAGAIWAGVWSPDLSTLAGWWWTLAVWASGAYLVAMVVVRDEPPPVYED